MTLQEIYKKYKDNEEDIKKILQMLKDYIEENKEEVTARLQSVASGELDMPETISPKEEKCFRALCGWIVAMGPTHTSPRLQALLKEPDIFRKGIKHDDDLVNVTPVWPPKEIADAIKEKIDAIIENGRATARQAILLISYIYYDEFHYPQPETGIYDIADNPFQKLKWLYRYWLNQLEVAEQGSGLEAHFTKQKNLNYEDIQIEELPEQPIIPTATISCAGDLLAVDVLTPENTQHLFDDIKDFYSTADIVSANLESTVDMSQPIGRTQASGQPARMNTSQMMFDKFRHEAGINYFSTATNHAMDWGICGLNATLDVLEKSGAYYSGTTKSCAKKGKEQDGFTIIEKNGIKIAMLAYTFDLNGYETPADKPYLVNVVRFNDADPKPDYLLIKKQVAAAKEKGAEHIIAYCHWGWEFEMYPHVNIREAAHKVIECGVDTIFGNHPHVSQPAELIEREGKQDALVVYAFGDFVSYHPESRNSKLAYIVKFDLMKFGGKVFRQHIKSLPIYIVNQHLGGKRYDCRIVKFEDVLKDPDGYGLTELEKSQLPHLEEKVWKDILSPLSKVGTR